MKILGLPGQNDATGPWMDDILSGIRGDDDQTLTQYYECWGKPGSQLDLRLELDKASRFSPDLVVAKSLGAVLTLMGVSNGSLTPRECVLIGVPVRGLQAPGREALSRWHERAVRTLFIQQADDVVGGFGELAKLVPESKDCTMVRVAGGDHIYRDTAELIRLINEWRLERPA